MVREARWLYLAVLLVVGASPSMAQDDVVVIDLSTNAVDADLYVDGAFTGRVGVRRFIVSPDARELRIAVDGGLGWSVPPISYVLDRGQPGDTMAVTMNFPYYYRLESTPAKADVFLRAGTAATRLGHTPTTIESPEPLSGILEFRLDGFEGSIVAPGRKIWNLHAVDLEPLQSSGATERPALSTPSPRRKWIDYAAVGTALVAGALAVHFKFEADRRYDRYRETGDPALRPGVRRYDIYSGIALGVMQAGVGLFAIRLVLR